MSYHKNKNIKKGTVGEFSKIEEEFEELKDAVEQKDKILILCEISDLLGAVELYLNKNFYESVSFENCIAFSRKTQNAFREGTRTNETLEDKIDAMDSWTEEDIRPMCNQENWDKLVSNVREKTMQAYVEESTKDDNMRVLASIDEELHKLNKEISEEIDGWHDTTQDKSFDKMLQIITHADKVRLKIELEEILKQEKNFDDEIEDFVYTHSDQV